MKIILLLILLALIGKSSSFQNNIYIDPNNGSNQPLCRTAKSYQKPCATLHYAFDENYRKPSTRYVLANTTHIQNATILPFENLSALAIVSEDGLATISCTEGETGLAFMNVVSLTLSDVVFYNCSANRTSTSTKNLTEGTLYKFQVALYFYLCRDVTMSQVTVHFSPNATGVVMYDTVGTNVIQNSIFVSNSVSVNYSVGGGGLYVEFTYCSPSETHCNGSFQPNNSNSSYLFQDCDFSDNTASNAGIEDSSTYIIPHQRSHQAFGRGGGLSVFVKGAARNNTFEVVDCAFQRNTALWGGGLFVEFHDQTANNSVKVSGCLFEENECHYTLTAGTGGGGMRLGHYVYDYNNHNDGYGGNKIDIVSCNFASNFAMYGGGLSISPTLQDTNPGYESLVTLRDLNFTNNTGKIGAALHIGLFPLVTIGIPLKVMIQTCAFIRNSAQYTDLLDKGITSYMIGIGTAYINNVPVSFRGENLFESNLGTALASAGVPVNFCNSTNTFFNNSGYRGGAIALLGSTYLLINSDTDFSFTNNTATDKGGAIYNRYIEMDNIKGQPNCFVRHTDPLKDPTDWNATFYFAANSDHSGERNNSIHTTSINPCSRAGGNSFYGAKDKLLCWTNWKYYDLDLKNVTSCSWQITSDVGNVTVVQNHDIRVIPGHQFQLPYNIIDDYGNDLINETVLSDSIATLHRSKYIWGGNATLRGSANSSVQLALDVLGDRIWHMNLAVELKPCPAGLVASGGNESRDHTCVCSKGYGDVVSCDQNSLNVTIKSQRWIGKLNWSSDSEYLVGLCPPGFCNTSVVTLPIDIDYNESSISSRICSSNRTGVMCGECTSGYGPAVNSLHYECVNCTDINLAVNIAKYVASIYLPLAILFSVLILFDVRLTTGPANAFILYCQAITSAFNIDADGQVPLNTLTHSYQALVNVYRVPYGIFNLEFVENLLPPFCFSSRFNVLSVLMLDYGVALFPLLMILMAVLGLKLKECCSGSRCCKITPESMHLPKPCEFMWKRLSVTEALLPAFAAFILLSYTKFGLTSSHIIITEPLLNESGSAVGTPRVYYAGHFSANNTSYRYAYLVPSSIIFAVFVCIIPILLLVYPLRAFEWCISKVHFLWRWYPSAKVHVFLDTFQGCYKINMRFFAGIYFIFRLAINVIPIATKVWLEQYVAQQMVCMIMVALVAICQPYNKENRVFNYIDVLIFTNLAAINALSLYLYASTSMSDKYPSLSIFVLQYILILLPLIYMIMYILWYAVKSCLKHSSLFPTTRTFQPINTIIQEGISDALITRSELNVDDYEEGEDEALFARAEMKNLFRSPSDSSGTSESYERVPSRDKRGSSKRTNSAKTTGSKGYGSLSSTERFNSHSGKRSTK